MEPGASRSSGVTVVIPTIPPRATTTLPRALRSAVIQSLPASAIIVEVDNEREGAAAVRHRGLMKVTTPWVAFLDDDDEFHFNHIERLMRHAFIENADFVYSWFETSPPGQDPFPPHHFTDDWNPADPIETTITVLVRTALAQEVGMKPHEQANPVWPGEDRRFTLECLARGAKISHLAERTWVWHHDSRNTSGLATRW